MDTVKPVKKRRLTIKQQKFVKEYVRNDGNGTQAALATYNTNDENTAHAIASENLQKPTIREKVDEALVKLQITPEWVLNNHKTIAEYGIEREEGQMRDTMASERALENIGKIQGLYPSTSNSLEIGDGSIKLTWGGESIMD
jgi:phage terminase small subunit